VLYCITIITHPQYYRERGIVFDRFLYLFISLFVSLSARLRENGWIDLHEIFVEGVERQWDELIQFWVNSEKLCDATMLISLSTFVNITSNQLFWQSIERLRM